MNHASVDVVCLGSIVRDGPAILEAHSTCTLVRTEGMNVLVDTSDRSYRRRLLDGLGRAGLGPEDIDILVITHAHHDHIGNIDLFTKARVIVHELENASFGGAGIGLNEMAITPIVKVVPTPGHSPGSISVLVEGEVRTAIAGDAIPTVDNFLKDLPPGHHSDREQAVRSMHLLIEWADVIVPGHGAPFPVRH